MLDGLPEAGLELDRNRGRVQLDLDGRQSLGSEVDRPIRLGGEVARERVPGEEQVAVVGDAADQRRDEQLGRRRPGVLAPAAPRLIDDQLVLSDPERELMAALVTGDDRSAADDQPRARHVPVTSIVPTMPG